MINLVVNFELQYIIIAPRMASGPAARVEGETGGGEVGDGEAGEGLGDESARQEKEHFQKVINAFLYYKWAGLL